jgi:hypothetical protein
MHVRIYLSGDNIYGTFTVRHIAKLEWEKTNETVIVYRRNYFYDLFHHKWWIDWKMSFQEDQFVDMGCDFGECCYDTDSAAFIRSGFHIGNYATACYGVFAVGFGSIVSHWFELFSDSCHLDNGIYGILHIEDIKENPFSGTRESGFGHKK